jgi:large subunit ribosomal protein L10
LKRTEKEKIVADLHERLGQSQAVFLADFTGLNVESVNKLRRDLRQRGDEFQVVKNTLLRRAAQDTPAAGLTESLLGPCGITISYQDPVASAKVLADFAKDREKFVFKGGVLQGKTIAGEAVGQLAKMPPREVLLGQMLSSLVAVPTGLVSALSGIIQKLLLTLKALEEEKAQREPKTA